MALGRREAFLAFVATLVPWLGKRATAQERLQVKNPTTVKTVPSPEIVDLQRRVGALETQLASQVAFTKDAYGNLSLKAPASITIDTAMNFNMKASGQVQLFGSGPTAIRGSTIALN